MLSKAISSALEEDVGKKLEERSETPRYMYPEQLSSLWAELEAGIGPLMSLAK